MAAITIVFILSIFLGLATSGIIIVGASLNYWHAYAVLQLGVGVAYLLAGGLCASWTDRRPTVLIPAALVAILPVMLSYTESVVVDNRRVLWTDLARDVSIGAAMWQSWASFALICAMALVGWSFGRWLSERRSG